MKVATVIKKLRVSKHDLIKYQILMEVFFFRKNHISAIDIELLVLLSMEDAVELRVFCDKIASEIYTNSTESKVRSQNVRNRVVALQKMGYIQKSTKGKKIKVIKIADEFKINNNNNILINYNLLSVNEPG